MLQLLILIVATPLKFNIWLGIIFLLATSASAEREQA